MQPHTSLLQLKVRQTVVLHAGVESWTGLLPFSEEIDGSSNGAVGASAIDARAEERHKRDKFISGAPSEMLEGLGVLESLLDKVFFVAFLCHGRSRRKLVVMGGILGAFLWHLCFVHVTNVHDCPVVCFESVE